MNITVKGGKISDLDPDLDSFGSVDPDPDPEV